ncbi:MAG: hypothetical protein PHS95_01660 [Candidatus Pacebacteria bacterium]|nr:hypothetical protein [Candidatus Paceibacterota bacterium]
MSKKHIIIIVSSIILLLAVVAIVRFWTPEDKWLCQNGAWVKHGNPEEPMPIAPCSKLSESEARAIAKSSCIKGGETLEAGTYNESSKTWWYNANLNSARKGCSPACIVNEETGMAEINWRCTGLKEPK